MSKFLALLSIGSLLVACRPYEQYRQTQTIANMQAIINLIDDATRAHRVPSKAVIDSCIHSVADGKDAWGNDFLIYFRTANGQWSYVLISRGSDGRLDSPNPAAYFAMTPHEVWSDPTRDIVVRDGDFITRAGK